MLYYDTAEAERVHGRPFDDELDQIMQMGMFAMDRISSDGTMHKIASADHFEHTGVCIRWARIEHCSEIEPDSAGWIFTSEDGTPQERETWSCTPGTPPMSHAGLTVPDSVLDSAVLPLTVAATHEFQADLDDYIGDYKAAVIRNLTDVEDTESTVTELRYVTKPNGHRVQMDDQGWGLTKGGRRDLRYEGPIGPPLP